MAQVMYNYPGMEAVQGNMVAHSTMIKGLGTAVESEQAALAATWIGGTGMNVQQWITQFNAALEECVQGLVGMANSYQQGTHQMIHRDGAEGAKWT